MLVDSQGQSELFIQVEYSVRFLVRVELQKRSCVSPVQKRRSRPVCLKPASVEGEFRKLPRGLLQFGRGCDHRNSRDSELSNDACDDSEDLAGC